MKRTKSTPRASQSDSACRASISATRLGFTLLEMLLVVMVLMVIAGLSWTPLMNAFADNLVKEGAENVRNMMANSRFQALESDSIWQFRYEPGGTRYMRIPYEVIGDAQTLAEFKDSGELPETIKFSGSATSGGQKVNEEMLAGLPDADELGSVRWSAPILFFPDGTATEIEFQVIGENSGVRRILVREVTGTVSVKKTEPKSDKFTRF